MNAIIWLSIKKIRYIEIFISISNQSVNDTEAHPQLGQVDYELIFLKSVRRFQAQARAPSSKLNKLENG